MSELKVLVNDNFAFASDHVAIAIVLQHNQDERSVMHFSEEGYARWDPVEPFHLGGQGTTPTFTIPNGTARALLDALMRHYQGASDMHTVRSDLLHERGRVDRLITAVVDLSDKALDSALGN